MPVPNSLIWGYRFAQPLFGALGAETAHDLSLKTIRLYGRLGVRTKTAERKIDVGGLHLCNRLGLAAGYDKSALAVEGLSKLGFGFVEIGGVTPSFQAGNPKPRLFKLAADRAVINRMGFNNDGVETVSERLACISHPMNALIGLNAGKSRESTGESAIQEYALVVSTLLDSVDFVTINVSSPNTPGMRELQRSEFMSKLWDRLDDIRKTKLTATGQFKPIFVKLDPDTDPVLMRELGIRLSSIGYDGIVATNTTTSRDGLRSRLAKEVGGLSGKPLLEKSVRAVEILRDGVGSSMTIVGVGGIQSAEDAIRLRRAGADLIQIYTGLVFRGPSLIDEILDAID